MLTQVVTNLSVASATILYDPVNSPSTSKFWPTGYSRDIAVEVINTTNATLLITVGGADYISGTIPTEFGKLNISNNPFVVDANSNGAISMVTDDVYSPLLYVGIQLSGTVLPTFGVVNAYINSRDHIIIHEMVK